jgi:hypothetical protein
MAKFGRDRPAARSMSASLLLNDRYLAIATSLKGQIRKIRPIRQQAAKSCLSVRRGIPPRDGHLHWLGAFGIAQRIR